MMFELRDVKTLFHLCNFFYSSSGCFREPLQSIEVCKYNCGVNRLVLLPLLLHVIVWVSLLIETLSIWNRQQVSRKSRRVLRWALMVLRRRSRWRRVGWICSEERWCLWMKNLTHDVYRAKTLKEHSETS